MLGHDQGVLRDQAVVGIGMVEVAAKAHVTLVVGSTAPPAWASSTALGHRPAGLAELDGLMADDPTTSVAGLACPLCKLCSVTGTTASHPPIPGPAPRIEVL